MKQQQKTEQFRFGDPRQEKIYRRLQLLGPGPASFYRDACRIIANQSLESTTHIVGHLLREIESALRAVLQSLVNSTSQPNDEKITGGERHKSEIRIILNCLNIPETDKVAQEWLSITGKNNEYGLHSRAHRDSLASPRPMDEEFIKFWDQMETILDIALDKFEAKYLESHRKLDELLQKSNPTEKNLNVLRNHVPNNLVSLGYFFDRLENPNWINPLREKGFFKKPPPLDKDETEGTVRFPIWPESRYLIRMAEHAPELVHDVALEIPDTENVRIHEDIVEAALAMPSELSAEFVHKVKIWLESPYHLLLPTKLGELLSHLAKGGQKEAGLDLARNLLEILPDKRPPHQAKGEYALPYFPEPHLHFEWMYYEQIFEKNVPDLVSVAGFDALRLLCNLLETAVRLSRSRDENDSPQDNSYIWQPAVEDHEQNWDRTNIKKMLVSAVRDAAQQLIKVNPNDISIIVDELENRRFYIFHRIALHLLRVFSENSTQLVSVRLTNRSLFDNICLRHEYVLLMKECFKKLSKSKQNKIIDWIKSGPIFDPQEQQKNRDEFTQLWQLERLAPIIDHLPKIWKKRYAQLVKKFGEPENPEFVISHSTWTGPTSPKSTDEIDQMTVDEIVNFLKSWQYPKDPMSPSPEGLGRTLSSVVATKPEDFASQANKFHDVDPTYVRVLFSGLSDAVKQSRKFPWPDVLDLCKWVIEQPRELSQNESEYGDLDKDWNGARKEIAWLLRNGFSVGVNEIPLEYRRQAWEVIKPLADDPQPTLEYEVQYGGSNMDPATLAINTVRGAAMHALINYALWIRRYLDKSVKPEQEVENSFDVMPEVREVLEAHLDPNFEPTEAIRSVYGQFFPWLVLLDPKWAKSNVKRIFPDDPQMSSLRDAAWIAYITFCRLYDNAFELLVLLQP